MSEVFTMGGVPYPGQSVQDVIQLISNGGSMQKTKDIPLKIYELMSWCWQEKSEDRPTFVQVEDALDKMLGVAGEVVLISDMIWYDVVSRYPRKDFGLTAKKHR